jgi:hypothetical protein
MDMSFKLNNRSKQRVADLIFNNLHDGKSIADFSDAMVLLIEELCDESFNAGVNWNRG